MDPCEHQREEVLKASFSWMIALAVEAGTRAGRHMVEEERQN
jgi:hypothetical protein